MAPVFVRTLIIFGTPFEKLMAAQDDLETQVWQNQ
jgi:hypothetical protein